MKLKLQIVHWITGTVLFEYETENNTTKKTLEEAVKRKANLQGADLRGANLWRADLQGADLRRANLWEANLQGADLRRANLRRANLWRANLQGADLRRAEGLRMYWHIHHEILVENLTETLKNRIAYIKTEKPKDEVKVRLKLLKKVKCKVEDYPTTKAGWEKLHRLECKNCPWTGKSIFKDKT